MEVSWKEVALNNHHTFLATCWIPNVARFGNFFWLAKKVPFLAIPEVAKIGSYTKVPFLATCWIPNVARFSNFFRLAKKVPFLAIFK